MSKSLADRVRQKLAAGTLPRETPVMLWAGWGTGGVCAACEEPIRAFQAEYELEYKESPSFRLHAGCHGFWDVEHRRPRWRPRPKEATTVATTPAARISTAGLTPHVVAPVVEAKRTALGDVDLVLKLIFCDRLLADVTSPDGAFTDKRPSRRLEG